MTASSHPIISNHPFIFTFTERTPSSNPLAGKPTDLILGKHSPAASKAPKIARKSSTCLLNYIIQSIYINAPQREEECATWISIVSKTRQKGSILAKLFRVDFAQTNNQIRYQYVIIKIRVVLINLLYQQILESIIYAKSLKSMLVPKNGYRHLKRYEPNKKVTKPWSQGCYVPLL
ncbi:hypothetical protein FGO68_gene6559 [Halteria grandinella]|uniref:Uncharacterized protein n=1 Tax=Halteria grandinella TaxID=5974 RepID=A0A8J8T9E8_HALGN|nr:hypothetical protein FGO68_gene6559 [Halteria grandinella]